MPSLFQQLGITESKEEREFRQAQEQRERIAGLLGTEAQPAVIGQFGAPQNATQPSPEDAFNRRFSTQLQAPQEGTGYLGSDRGIAAQTNLINDAIGAGASESYAMGLLQPQQNAQSLYAAANKPTSFSRDFAAYQGADPTTQSQMVDWKKAGATNVNLGTKLPANYMWKDPNNPLAGVTPIPGGPGAKPTAAEAKQMSQGDMSQIMLKEIQRVFETGMDVSDPKLWAETEIAQIPFISWATKLTPDEASLTSNLQQFENQYMAMLRGAQVGPAEQKLFRKQLPQIGQSKELFAENLRNSQRNLLIMIQRISDLRQFDQKGNAAPMVAPTAPPPGFVRD